MRLEWEIARTFLGIRNGWKPGFTASVSILGVTVGVAAFLVVVTVLNSFETQLRSILMAANPNLIVYAFPRGIANAENAREKIQGMIEKDVEKSSLFYYNEAILSKEERSAAIVIRGIQGTRSSSQKDLDRAITPKNVLSQLDKGTLLLNKKNVGIPKMVIGNGVSLKLNVKVGDRVFLITTSSSQTKQKLQPFQVIGIFHAGLEEYDGRLVLISFEDGQALFGEAGYATGIEFKLKDPAKALVVSDYLQDKTPNLVRAWQELDKRLFDHIERDGRSIKLIVFLISFVAAFNIIATLSLSVLDRSKQIATLRGMGASRKLILQIFIAIGVLIGVVGTGLGSLVAILLLKIFSQFELGDLKQFYFLDKIPVDLDFKLFVYTGLCAIALSFVSALVPAIQATVVSPLLGLKPHHPE